MDKFIEGFFYAGRKSFCVPTRSADASKPNLIAKIAERVKRVLLECMVTLRDVIYSLETKSYTTSLPKYPG